MFQDTRAIENKSHEPLVVWLEPWASDYILAPGQSLTVIGTSAKEGQFDVAEYSDKVGIYLWPGSSVQIFQDGQLIDDFESLGDDGPPSSAGLRQFIEDVFGGPGETGNDRLVKSNSTISRRDDEPPIVPTMAILACLAAFYAWFTEAGILLIHIFAKQNLNPAADLALIFVAVSLSVFAWMKRADVLAFRRSIGRAHLTGIQILIVSSFLIAFCLTLVMILMWLFDLFH